MKSHRLSGYLLAALVFISSSFFFYGCKKNNNAAALEITVTGIPCVGSPVTFSCSAHAGSVYNWLFGDTASSTVSAPQHMYADTGTYTITVYVNNVQDKPITKTITIYPALQITYTGTPIAGDTLSFQCIAPAGINITSYLWNFGDGSTSKSSSPKHSYSNNGPVDLNLTLDSYTKDTISQIFSIVTDPVYTSALVGTWNWTHNHIVLDSGVSTSNDTTFAIAMVNEATVSIGPIKLEYEPSDSYENNLIYGYNYYNPFVGTITGTYTLRFDHSDNQLQYTVYLRAANGEITEEDTYQSN